LDQPHSADGTSSTSTPVCRSTSVLATATPHNQLAQLRTFWHTTQRRMPSGRVVN
jgi:hypothetical protein